MVDGELKKKSRNYGHKKGLEVVEKIIETAIKEKYKIFNIICFQQKIGKDPQRK